MSRKSIIVGANIFIPKDGIIPSFKDIDMKNCLINSEVKGRLMPIDNVHFVKCDLFGVVPKGNWSAEDSRIDGGDYKE